MRAITCGMAMPTHREGDGRRRIAEALLRLASFLPMAERSLVEAVFGESQSVASVARRAPGTSPVRLRYRLRAIVRRMLSARFQGVARRLAVTRGGWDATSRDVARACVIEGKSAREASRELKLPYDRARRVRAAVLAAVAMGEVRP